MQAEDLSKMVPELNFTPIAFQLQVPDDIIRERSRKTGRQSDNSQIIEQRIKDYHREMDAISFYFPKANIVAVDANKPEAEVWKAVQTGLDGVGIKPLPIFTGPTLFHYFYSRRVGACDLCTMKRIHCMTAFPGFA